MDAKKQLSWPGGRLSLDRCRVMGILNVTPDSFSDGGKFNSLDRAVEQAWKMAEEGADLIDIGAESTRPGAAAVDEAEETRRVWPVLEALKAKKFPLPISLDTAKANLAARAYGEGMVQILNDVEGLRNPAMAAVVRELKAPCIIMHMFGTPRTMQQDYQYNDVVRDIIEFFRKRLDETGLHENVVVDPGIGFGKGVEHNLAILRRLNEFQELGHPIMVGASRKSFIGKVLGGEVDDRLEGSLAAAAIATFQRASIVRVHDVRPTVRVVRLVSEVLAA